MANNTVVHSVEFTGDASKLQAACAQAAQAVTGLGNTIGTNSSKVNSFNQSLNRLGASLSSIGTSLTIGFTAPMALLGKQIFSTTANIEQIAVSFKVFTGSAKVAKEMLGELKDQAIRSPMQFQDITKGAQTLLGYGLTAQQVIPITRMLGDISGGNADKFNRLSLAFGQVNAAGRLMGQEARQMINAGFNPLQAISEKTGESMASLTKRMHDGKISVKEVGDAFIYATSEGGRFHNLALEQSNTLIGSFNKLKESATFALAEIGDSINKELNVGAGLRQFAGFINELKDRFMQLTPEAKELNLKFIAIGVAIGPILIGIGKVISLVDKLRTSVTLLSTSNGGIIKVLLSLALAFTATKVAGAMYDDVMDAATKKDPNLLRDANEQLKERIKNYDELIKKAPKAGFAETDPNGIDSKYVKSKTELMGERFKLYKQYYDNLSLIQKLEKNLPKDTQLTGLNNKPAAGGPPPPPKPIEVIPGIDLWTKEYGNKLKALIKENEEAGKTISRWWDDNDVKRLKQLKADYEAKLEIVQKEFEGKKDIANKGEIDITNITAKYQAERLAILRKGSEQEISARDRARKVAIEDPFKQIVIDDAKKKVGSFNQVWDSLVSGDKTNSMRELSTSLYSAMKDFGMNITVGFGELVGAAISGGMSFQESFQALTKLILTSIGDLLIQAGTAAIKFGLFKEGIEKALVASGIGGASAIAIGIAAVAAGTALKSLANKQEKSVGQPSSMQLPSSTKATGSSYQYGGSSFATSSMKLSIDLTGSITQTQTGYQINKSLETVLRVTGR